MRHPLRFRSDRPDYSLLAGVINESGGDSSIGSEPRTSLTDLASRLSVGNESSSIELALDLVLNEIAEQVRLSTGASGVAIALTRSGELVCRATTGSAPALGVRLDPYSGLSGICLQTKTVQRCDDTETDSRVDIAACRNLRIRSILSAPIIRRDAVIGLIEAFSGEPGHFDDRDAETLVSFCRRIVNTIDSSEDAASSLRLDAARRAYELAGSPQSAGPTVGVSRSRSWDRWTVFLTVAVIASAILLGWMIGLAGRHRSAIRDSLQSDTRVQQRLPDQKTYGDTMGGIGPSPDASVPPTTTSSTQGTDVTKPKTARDEKRDGGLIVYQNGKVVFRETPIAQPGPSRNATDPRIEGIIPAGKTEVLTPESANQYVAYRVEPRYPESAANHHIEGTVLLKVLVGKDGGVQQVQVKSGDPKLAAAAADAVVQWRFRPVARAGQPVEFQTQVRVEFKLPGS